jgi:hypothetical protein
LIDDSAARFVRDRIHFDLALDHRTGFDRGTRNSSVRKVLAKDLVVAPEIAAVGEIYRDFDHVVQIRAVEQQNAANALDGPARLLLDVAAGHVAVLILGHLSRDVDEVARAHARVKGQIRIALADGGDLVVHLSKHPDLEYGGLDHIDAALPVDQIAQTAIVDGDIV